jgi:hypothetical protein
MRLNSSSEVLSCIRAGHAADGGPDVPGASGHANYASHAGHATGHRPSGLGLGLSYLPADRGVHMAPYLLENLEAGGAAFHIELPAGQ